jgi:phospholipid transport system transporter-binding protein
MVNLEGDRLVVSGPVTMDTAPEVRARGEALMLGRSALVVDLSQVTDMDSSALALALAWLRGAEKAGASLSFAPASQSFRSLADLYGVAALLAQR